MQETLGQKDPLEKEMAIHSILENSTEPGGSQRVRHG